MGAGDTEPEGERLALRRALDGEVDGDLRHAEQDVDQVAGDLLDRFGGVPHQHVGVDGERSGDQPGVDDALPVLLRAERAVDGPDHGGVGPQAGADVGLAVLDHRLGRGGDGPAADLGEQQVQALVHGGAVGLRSGCGRVLDAEPVDEVDLEPVHAPFLDGPGEPVDQVGADRRVAGVDDDGAHVGGVDEGEPAQFGPGGAVLPDERQRVPEHVLDAEVVDAGDVGGGVGQ